MQYYRPGAIVLQVRAATVSPAIGSGCFSTCPCAASRQLRQLRPQVRCPRPSFSAAVATPCATLPAPGRTETGRLVGVEMNDSLPSTEYYSVRSIRESPALCFCPGDHLLTVSIVLRPPTICSTSARPTWRTPTAWSISRRSRTRLSDNLRRSQPVPSVQMLDVPVRASGPDG